MSFKMKVDKAPWEKIKRNLLQANQYEIRTGIVTPTQYGSDNDNLEVAQNFQWQEEGVAVKNIPPRPAMRVGFMAPIQRGSYDKYFVESMIRIADGKSTFMTEYTKLGNLGKMDLKEAIENWDTPPNSPITIAEKGFNDPLIHTRTLLNSIDSSVEKRGS